MYNKKYIFNPTQAIENNFELVLEGKHNARIIKVEEQISKNGNEMLVVFIQPDNYKFPLKYYITLSNLNSADIQKNGFAQKLLVDLHVAFEIPYDKENPQELNAKGWVGHTGVIEVEHELYDSKKIAKIKKCIPLENIEEDDLPF